MCSQIWCLLQSSSSHKAAGEKKQNMEGCGMRRKVNVRNSGKVSAVAVLAFTCLVFCLSWINRKCYQFWERNTGKWFHGWIHGNNHKTFLFSQLTSGLTMPITVSEICAATTIQWRWLQLSHITKSILNFRTFKTSLSTLCLKETDPEKVNSSLVYWGDSRNPTDGYLWSEQIKQKWSAWPYAIN